MECLIINKICPASNRKCKVCRLEDCNKTFNILEEEEKMLFETEKSKLNKELKKEYSECLNCPFLEIRDLEKGQVKCFYRIKDRCLLEKEKMDENKNKKY